MQFEDCMKLLFKQLFDFAKNWWTVALSGTVAIVKGQCCEIINTQHIQALKSYKIRLYLLPFHGAICMLLQYKFVLIKLNHQIKIKRYKKVEMRHFKTIVTVWIEAFLRWVFHRMHKVRCWLRLQAFTHFHSEPTTRKLSIRRFFYAAVRAPDSMHANPKTSWRHSVS